MAKAVLRLVQTVMKTDPNDPVIDESIMEHYQDLISMEELYLFPKECLFRWAKMSTKLNPEKARILFQQMHVKFGTEALVLLEFMEIEPKDANSCALALSGFDNCPICKNVFDSENPIYYDYKYVIDKLTKEKEELALLIQKHQEDLENERKLNSDLNLKLSNAQEELKKADNFVKLAKIDKNNLEKELDDVKTKALAATSDMKKLQDEVFNLQDIKKKLEIDLQKSRDEAARIQVLLNKKNNEEKNPSISLSPLLPQTTKEFLYKSSLFEGILHGLPLLMNSILDDYVIVTASYFDGSSCIPSNVLKNDSSCWHSWFDDKTVLKPNEWIQFDFKCNKVAINAYAFKVDWSPKSWKIEGSNDNKSFTIIHNKTLNEDFNQAWNYSWDDPKREKLYTLDKVSNMFRYIRITQGDDGNWDYPNDPTRKHVFSFYRIELFGYYQQ